MDQYIVELEAYCRDKKISQPVYNTKNVSGFYTSTVTIGERITDTGADCDKREAMNCAAKQLLSKIKDITHEELVQTFSKISMNGSQCASNGTITSPLIIDNKVIDNTIGYLTEFCQQKKYSLPIFEEPVKSGEDHSPHFAIKCKVTIDNKEIVGEGMGKSVKEARKASAAQVIRKIRVNVPDPSAQENKKLLEYLSENFSDNSELKVYIEENQENDYCKKLAKIAPIVGCHVNYVQLKDSNKVMLQLIIQSLSQNNNKLITSYGSSDEGLEASKRMAAKNAISMLQILNSDK